MASPGGLLSNILRARSILEIIAFEVPDLGRSILRAVTPEVHEVLRELCINLLSGCLPMHKEEDIVFFRKQKPLLRSLANPRSSLKSIQRLLRRKTCFEPIQRLVKLALLYFSKHHESPSRKIQSHPKRSSSKSVEFVEARSSTQRPRAQTPAEPDESNSE